MISQDSFLSITTTGAPVVVLIGNATSRIVAVDLSAELDGNIKLLSHDFQRLINRNVDLEEASVSLREGFLMFVCTNFKSMLIFKVACVCWKLGAAPGKLEVLAPLILSEVFEHRPEHLHRLVVGADARIAGDCLEC